MGSAAAMRVARELLGGATGGLLGAVAFLYVTHQGEKRGSSEQDWVRGFGNLLQGETGAEVVRRGFWWTLIGFALAGLVMMPLIGRLMAGRPWYLQAVPVSVGAFLAWGLIFSPLVGDDTDAEIPGGLFGADAGMSTFVTYVLACAALGAVMARVSTLMATLEFWAAKHFDLRESLDALELLGLEAKDVPAPKEGRGLLEFPEERRE
jgi:hypothetical protein